MTEPNDNRAIDDFLRTAAGAPTPTEANRAYVKRALDRAIREAGPARKPKRSPWRWTAPAIAGSLAVILAVVLIMQVTRPSPAEAALNLIAAAADLAEPLTIPQQSYAYTRSLGTVVGVVPPDNIDGRNQSLAYLLPQTREVWISGTGAVQISTTTHTPEFFTAKDETDYYKARIDTIDQIGTTVTETFTGVTSILDERDWPTNPADLKTAIIESLLGQPHDAAIAKVALTLTAESGAPPQLKAAALRLISTLDEITITERLPDGGGIFDLDYSQPQPASLRFTLDGTGNVLRITLTDIDGDPTLGIPPGTPTEDTSYQPTIIVASLDTP